MSSYRMKYKIGATQYHIPVVDDMAGFGSGIPLGTILPYSANTLNPPEGFLFCDGSAISRSMYPDLFALIGTLYGSGDGSTTFNLPDLTGGKFLEGTTAAGTSKSAGLPNITGEYSSSFHTNASNSGSGVFTTSTSNGKAGGPGTSATVNYDWVGVKFSASDSNAIYGNSQTVQPSSVTVRYIIKAFSATTSESALIDITNYASALNGKMTHDEPYTSNFTIVYPNNGTAQNPATVTYNNKYVMDNPFPGYYVYCIPEVFYLNKWTPIYHANYGTSGSSGAIAGQLNDDKIVLVTSYTQYFIYGNDHIYHGTLIAEPQNDNPTSAPCRIKVWKIGKIPS